MDFILSGKTTSFGRGQSELALPEVNKSIGGVMEWWSIDLRGKEI